LPDRIPELEIRSYRPEDADALWAILFAAFENGELKGSTRVDVERWHSRLPGDPEGNLVAVADGRVAGVISPRHEHLVVGRDFRRRGIGTRLVEASEALSRERGDGPLYLALPHENEGALAFYRALGFRYHHSLWNLRLRDDAAVPPPSFPADLVRHPYQDEDAIAFAELVNAAFLDHPTPFTVTVDQIRFTHTRPEFDPANLCLLSPVNEPENLIAFCRVVTDDDGDRTTGHVRVLGVLPGWRRRGLGRELLRWGVHRLRDLGVAAVEIAVEGENARALRLYEQTGFERSEEWPRFARPTG
jgi:mycothiol synthase